jgi:Ca2+-binding RTX toxin-like protein
MPAPHRDQPTEPLFVEPLEQRRLMAASATLDLGELKITGTENADVIRLTINTSSKSQITVTINGESRKFTRSDVETINIQAGQGNDRVNIDNGKVHLDQPTRIYGSGGNDTITGGQGKDRIYGGSGTDDLSGGDTRDIVYGEGGNDRLDGELGNDVLYGGAGNDTITGGRGIDRLRGDDGDDTFHATDDFVDSADGGNGTDTATDHDDDFDNLLNIEID